MPPVWPSAEFGPIGQIVESRPQRRLATPDASSLTHLSVLSRRRGAVTAREGGAATFVLSGDFVAARRRCTLMMLINRRRLLWAFPKSRPRL